MPFPAKLQNTGPLLTMHQTSRLVWLVCSLLFALARLARLLFALTKLIAGSYALMYIKMTRLARLLHLCPGLHANAKIAIFAKNRKNRKLCKESPTRTRDFGENCDFCDFSQKSLKSPPFSGTCVLYHFSVVPCLRF